MKSMRGAVRNFSIAAAALAALGCAGSLHAEKAGAAKVVRLTGGARYSAADGQTWKIVEVGTVLKSGAFIQTAPNSTVDLCLKEAKPAKGAAEGTEETMDNVIRLLENSRLNLVKLSKEEIQFDLRSGALMGSVGKVPAGARYEIKLPRGVAGILGGTYIADASGAINELEGDAVLVVVAADNSLSTRKLASRQGYDPNTGEIVPLHLGSYPQPLTCSGAESPASVPAPPLSGAPRGPGMGGALRKF